MFYVKDGLHKLYNHCKQPIEANQYYSHFTDEKTETRLNI